MTKKFPVDVLLSIAMDRLVCDFSAMHECAEFLVGGPVFTHQFAHAEFCGHLKEAVISQRPQLDDPQIRVIALGHLALAMDDGDLKDASNDRRMAYIRGWLSKYIWPVIGKELELSPIKASPDLMAESFSEPLAGKDVVIIKE